ncbi:MULTISPECIES: hypothetical protein [Vibrio]|uniref:hypothetical protein n=1 Tax=Vibrio TaxID=662 RepID=UPI0004D7A75E|nr:MULTISPECIES: hypothetical protein [Vibrio]EGR0036479.1 hypothetical protein [Vibrio parahaemolyticus]EGR0204803.1 hypothetical protein [Vibrio parahaemolyticus]EGR2784278.1 hypothetical protein [Vibrio parahaemolyticus]EGR9083709.1 hypothetical protein [Vibrio parahaemolyticus]EHS1223178.1 hypothetical protein [Vibrio parahaemolyticus]
MSRRSKAAGIQKLKESRAKLIASLWGDELENINIWDRTTQDGWTTLPRVIPQICRILDKFADKGKPVSGTYISLWCNVFDDGFIEVKDAKRLAFEAGFSGERAVSTWSTRMKNLASLGFISVKEGVQGDFNYVLIVNPFDVIEKIYEKETRDVLYNALVSRMNEVGASF